MSIRLPRTTPLKHLFSPFSPGRIASRRNLSDRHANDVVPGDLGATLAAHRESNLRLKIRKVKAFNSAKRPRPALAQPGARELPTEPSNASHDAVEEDSLSSKSPVIRHKNVQQSRIADEDALAYGSYVEPLIYTDERPMRPYQDGKYPTNTPALDGWHLLHNMTANLADWVALSDTEARVRDSLAQSIIALLQQKNPHLVFELFGSIKTGLSTPTSDIDIGFHIPALTEDEPDRVVSLRRPLYLRKYTKALKALHRDLLDTGMFRDVELILGTRVPLIRMIAHSCNMEVQIAALPNGDPAPAVVNTFQDQLPALKPIYLTVKTALDARGLMGIRQGGLAPYALVCMIVAYLKLSGSSKRDSLGLTLWGFFDFYAKFNTVAKCISVDPAMVFQKHMHKLVDSLSVKDKMRKDPVLYWQKQMSLANSRKPYLLVLQDPANPSNNLGASSYRIMDVIEVFRNFSTEIKKWLHQPQPSNPSDPFVMLFGNMLGSIRDKRLDLLRHARPGPTAGQPVQTSIYGPTTLDEQVAKVMSVNTLPLTRETTPKDDEVYEHSQSDAEPERHDD